MPMKGLRFLFAASFILSAFPVAAQDWKLIVSDRGRRIEIDAEHIINSDRGTKVAWSRVVMSGQAATTVGYSVVKALNRYDCLNRSFSTVRRVYLDTAGKVLREEVLNDAVPVLVARNSVDERMWREVCRPPDEKTLPDVVKAIEKAAQGQVSTSQGDAKPVVPAGPATLKEPIVQAAKPSSVKSAAAKKEVTAKVEAKPAEPVVRQPAVGAKVPPSAVPPVPPVSVVKPPLPSPVKEVAKEVRPSGAAPPKPLKQNKPAAVTHPVVSPENHGEGADWHYPGNNGPENWGELRPEWKVCMRGQRQAPIDLTNAIKVDLEPVEFNFLSTRLRIADTGKMLQVYVEEPMDVVIRGQVYTLESLTFHRPADVLIDGWSADMSVQFSLRAANGKMAIVVVLLEQGERSNALLQKVLNNLPLEKGEQYMPAAPFNLAESIPSDPGHYMYMGSLPEPPCTEGVLWVVMRQPLSVSSEQLEIMDRLYPGSARPVQPANGRLILQSR